MSQSKDYRPLQIKSEVYEGLLNIQERLTSSLGFKPTVTNTLEHVIQSYNGNIDIFGATKEFQKKYKQLQKRLG